MGEPMGRPRWSPDEKSGQVRDSSTGSTLYREASSSHSKTSLKARKSESVCLRSGPLSPAPKRLGPGIQHIRETLGADKREGPLGRAAALPRVSDPDVQCPSLTRKAAGSGPLPTRKFLSRTEELTHAPVLEAPGENAALGRL